MTMNLSVDWRSRRDDIQSIRSEQFERVDFAFFASDARSTRGNWKAARDFGDTVVDLSYALEEEAGAGSARAG